MIKYFIYGFILIQHIQCDYDNDSKEEMLFNEKAYEKIIKEQEKNGYIEYNNDVLSTINKIDEDGTKHPIICFVIINNNKKSLELLKTLKIINQEINTVFKKYKNIDNNNLFGYEILFITINSEEQNMNEDLRKLLRNFPHKNSPYIIFSCLKKKCKAKECKENSKHYKLIELYIIYNPFEDCYKNIIKNILNKILDHGFNEKL